jgi:hypothetical protein
VKENLPSYIDKCGISTPGKTSELIIGAVKEHTASFPIEITHCMNGEQAHKYLHEKLNVKETCPCLERNILSSM